MSSIIAGRERRPATEAWIAPATAFSTATPNTVMGARIRSSISRVPARSAESGMSTPCTPAISIVIAIRPGGCSGKDAMAPRSVSSAEGAYASLWMRSSAGGSSG